MDKDLKVFQTNMEKNKFRLLELTDTLLTVTEEEADWRCVLTVYDVLKLRRIKNEKY